MAWYRLLVCAVGLLAFALSNIPFVLRHLANTLPTLLFLASLGIVCLVTGIIVLRRGLSTIGHEEVERLRKAERRRLFQYAQGIVPWWYRHVTIFLMLVFSLFLTAFGSNLLADAFITPDESSWATIAIGIFLLLTGIYGFLQTYIRAKTARKLAKLSSQELALRRELGEVTQGE